MIAIVNQAFRKGEIARVVRDPDSSARGILVLSERILDDHALFLASSALELDWRRFPSITMPRVVNVWEDGRVTTGTDGYIGSVDLSLLPATRTTGILEHLRARTAAESTAEIPHIGHARLLKF
jgi:hypothetical protein